MKRDELVLHCCLNQKTSPIPFIDKLDGVMYWVIECFNCNSFELSHKTKKDVIEKWNKRILKKKSDKLKRMIVLNRQLGKPILTHYYTKLFIKKELENEKQAIKANCTKATISQGHPNNSEKGNKNGEESFVKSKNEEKSKSENTISKEDCKIIKEEE